MKKIRNLIAGLIGVVALASCSGNSKTIRVCASSIPHAEVLEESVKKIVEEKGYKLEVKVLDWTIQNGAVANKDYDANYFQHIPYLESGDYKDSLVATCKVHYEPLGIYRGKATGELSTGKTFSICNDVSNAIRAFELLKAKGVLNTIPVSEDKESLTFEGNTYTQGDITIKLVAEELLAATRVDYDFACLPCNTAYTGNVTSDLQVAKEDDPAQVSLKANVLAVRKADYLNNQEYKEKIDVLTDALLSKEVSDYFKTKYLGAMTCDSSSQIDLRNLIK
jgi:D-methionine transport system substrate-binding protein